MKSDEPLFKQAIEKEVCEPPIIKLLQNTGINFYKNYDFKDKWI